jgi:hypothetical protein
MDSICSWCCLTVSVLFFSPLWFSTFFRLCVSIYALVCLLSSLYHNPSLKYFALSPLFYVCLYEGRWPKKGRGAPRSSKRQGTSDVWHESRGSTRNKPMTCNQQGYLQNRVSLHSITSDHWIVFHIKVGSHMNFFLLL